VSIPRTEGEKTRFETTRLQAGPAENVVSTACPACGVRFVMLAHYQLTNNSPDVMPFWYLRCTVCGEERTGELKPPVYGT
jgi:DNA-directed RNA polymerase subunit M/transcription elongation factor TFIIS